jgi:hypothetical protein
MHIYIYIYIYSYIYIYYTPVESFEQYKFWTISTDVRGKTNASRIEGSGIVLPIYLIITFIFNAV